MTKIFCLLGLLLFISCKTTTYYVVRHAEKDTNTMNSDVPLSAEGKQRAKALKDALIKQNVRFIFSTNYIRTRSTAQPLADAKNISINIYDPRDTTFVTRIKNINRGNILIVGHSNTVDGLVNSLTDQKVILGDLPDSQYGDLFMVKKKGKKFSFQKGHFGK